MSFSKYMRYIIYFIYSMNVFRINSFNISWSDYKLLHNKSYSNILEVKRRLIWEQNQLKILQHNAEAGSGGHSYRLAPNHLADISRHHYHKNLLLLKPSRRHFKDTLFDKFNHGDPDGLPQTFDWRDLGLITESLDQKDCGSCYAFSVAGAVQGQFFRKNGTLEYLSPQQLVDCSVFVGNYGCNGGSLRKTARYVESKGLMLESDYPYKGRQSICRYNFLKHTIKIKSWTVLPPRDEHALKVAVVTKGPVVVAVNASPHTFQLYHSGVYDDHNCPDDALNHAMLLIGYTEDAWILKNWWTNRWGHDGYMYLRRNVNRCGIADYAMIVEIE